MTLLLPLLLACAPKIAPTVAPEPVGLAIDPAVTTGTLDNGLRYFIEPNPFPKDRAELRLVVYAGSTQEDDDQRGGAHLVEHMAFNGTRDFPGSALIGFLESAGVQFGADLNAHTAFEETVYKLQVPTDDPAMLPQALQVLDNWAEGILFDPDEVEAERRVVLEEWRNRRGAGSRAWDALRPLLYHQSIYAERDVIGTEESLTGMSREALVRFYDDWYRPDLMAVMVVGPVDVAAVEAEIQRAFGDNTAPPDARPRLPVSVPGHAEPQVLSRADPEVTRSSVALMEKVDWSWPRDEAGIRALFIERTYFDLLGERLHVVARETDAPFLSAGVGYEDLNRERGLISMGASARVGQELEALEALVWETRRAAQHGFHASELDRSRAEQLQMAESWLTERDHAPSREAIGELVRHFLDEEWMAGTESEVAYYRRILPTVTLAELQAYARGVHTGQNRVVVVTVPGGEGAAPPPTAAQVRAALERADATEHVPWQPVVAEGPLVPTPPAPGAVTDEMHIDDLGVTRWTLSNGATVWVKPTDLANDEVLLAGWSPGGRSLVSDADYASASAAASIALRSGAGPFTDRQLGQALAGHDAGVGVSIGQTWEEAWGSTRPADLELTLKLLYQRMVDPRFDPDMVALDRQNRIERLERRTQDPEARFADLRDAVLWGNHLRYRAWTPDDVARIDPAVAERIYRERFGNAADFAFAIVGDVDLEALRPLVEHWIGGMPGDPSAREEWADVLPRQARGPRREVLVAGQEPLAKVQLLLPQDSEATREQLHRAEVVERLAAMRLRTRLREQLGGTYGVNVQARLWQMPEPGARVTVSFQCDPERVDELLAATREELARLRDEPVKPAELSSTLAQMRREHEVAIQKNATWLSWLRDYPKRGWNISDIGSWELDPERLLKGDTPAALQRTARSLLAEDAAIELIRMPEG